MNPKYKLIFFILVFLALLLTLVTYLQSEHIAMLNPKGTVALEERNLMIIATVLMLIVVIPVFILTIIFAWQFRVHNTKAKYSPNWDHSLLFEAIWWAFPCAIILVLSIQAYESSYSLDPYKPIHNGVKPLKIQVVALQWKWLFIYPEQKIATINYAQIPVETPIAFEITADAPMNSFWIPELGGQIYAMPGMKTELHLLATATGVFNGASANFSGKGFSGMSFKVNSSSEAEFNDWAKSVKNEKNSLDVSTYKQISKPSEYTAIAFYNLQDVKLFDKIVDKFMAPMPEMEHSTNRGL